MSPHVTDTQAVNIRKFVVRAHRLDDLVGLRTLTSAARRVSRRLRPRRPVGARLGRKTPATAAIRRQLCS